MKKILFLVSTVFLIACQAVLLTVPTQSDLDRVADKYPNYTLAELQEGKKMYELHCQTCHSLKSPTKETEEGWKHEVPDMVAKAKKKKGIIIDKKTEESILKYLVTMSSAPKPVKSNSK